MAASHLRKKTKFSKDLLFYINIIFKVQGKHVSVEKKRIFVERKEQHTENKHLMMGRKSQLLIIEEESLMESLRKYRCLYDKSCADYKNKVFVENAWAAVDKEMSFEEGKEFSYFLCRMKFKQRTRKIFY